MTGVQTCALPISLLEEAMERPFSMLRRLGKKTLNESEETYQLTLFENDDNAIFSVEEGE